MPRTVPPRLVKEVPNRRSCRCPDARRRQPTMPGGQYPQRAAVGIGAFRIRSRPADGKNYRANTANVREVGGGTLIFRLDHQILTHDGTADTA